MPSQEARVRVDSWGVPIILSIVFALLLAVFIAVLHLWSANQVQDAYIHDLRSRVQSLEDQSEFSGEIERQRELVEAIAERLGVDIPEGGSHDSDAP